MTLEQFKTEWAVTGALIPSAEEMHDYLDVWIAERDQLKARVMELEKLAKELAPQTIAQHQALIYAGGILNRTSAQSLDARDREVAAMALRSLRDQLSEIIDGTDDERFTWYSAVIRIINLKLTNHRWHAEAAKLRTGGEKG